MKSAAIVTHIFREMELHIGYCAGFGISREEMEKTEEKEGEQTPVLGLSSQ
jgi:hydroxymethylpyrimidine/phosphomethylpyrimidine kinase